MKKAIWFFSFLLFLSTNFIPVHASNEPVRGIYVTAKTVGSPRFNELLSLVKHSDLNAMVIDIKDDHGNLTFQPPESSPYFSISRPYIKDPVWLLKTLRENHIFPIARVVVFKDSVIPALKPSWTFQVNSGIWKNQKGDSFTNPFLKEVWEYNIGMAILAAKLGFKEIQFDYVRFPEKFETFEKRLVYKKNQFEKGQSSDGANRIAAITEFVQYAKKKLTPYHVQMSVDVFGNATVIPEAPGIGQDFSKISQNVDVISAMIYPSHWNPIFGIQKPDLEPFHLIQEYAKIENSRLNQLHKKPISRPWIQDFTATWLGTGNYKKYGKKEIEDQIRALQSQGINQFLLWNGSSVYTRNVDYTP